MFKVAKTVEEAGQLIEAGFEYGSRNANQNVLLFAANRKHVFAFELNGKVIWNRYLRC